MFRPSRRAQQVLRALSATEWKTRDQINAGLSKRRVCRYLGLLQEHGLIVRQVISAERQARLNPRDPYDRSTRIAYFRQSYYRLRADPAQQ